MFDTAPDSSKPAIDAITEKAANRLRYETPEHSAFGVLSSRQKSIAIHGLFILSLAVVLFPASVFIGLNILLSGYFLSAMIYRLVLMIIGARSPLEGETGVLSATDPHLPVITILAPLYNDAGALASLNNAIQSLDYPADKKDVKFLLEDDDHATIAEARRLGLKDRFDVILIPPIGPRTKPKACNVGLELARGSLVVIYDAEDRPEPDQLLKAAHAFAVADDRLACVQARLNYFNGRENWLTRLFTLEYSLWFDWLLPALQRLRAPIPLGGTSNFFRRDILSAAGGWDAHNVTEDADLGLRLSKLGYRVEMLNSTTFEEANCRYGNWIRQRSRWIKGHLQTWFVHMRAPRKIIQTTGIHGLFSIQLFLAGNVFSALLNPILWTVYFLLQASQFTVLDEPMAGWLQHLSLTSLIAGNLCFIVCACIAPVKRGWGDLCRFGLTAPVYWALTSLAAYKALWQIVFRPYYWEKTDHMISRLCPENRDGFAGKSSAGI